MKNNKGTQNGGLDSSSSAPFDPFKYIDDLVNFEYTKEIVFTDDEIRKIATLCKPYIESFEEVKNLVATLCKPDENYNPRLHFPTKELEDYYKVCPRPNEKQRRELAEELGIPHLPVMFWFKKRRKQTRKTLRAEMEKLQLQENMKGIETVCLCSCNKCSKRAVLMLPEDHELKVENEKLKKEYAELLSLVHNFCHN